MPRFNAAVFFFLLAFNTIAAASSAEIEQMISQQRYADAVRLGEEQLRQRPQDAEARFLTAYACQMGGRLDRAEELYRELIDAHPELPEPRNNLAIIYLGQGDYDRASQLLVDALKTRQSYATAFDNLNRIYKGIASEAYRRAVSESSEPASYRHDIELTAIARLEPGEAGREAAGTGSAPAAAAVDEEALLIERVKGWAKAWSAQDFAAYTGYYAPAYRADFASHEQWLSHRRERILRPGAIRVEVTEVRVRWRSDQRAIVDFHQAFDSSGYSDRVAKRLGFERIGAEWKITEERVLSVL